MKSYCLLFVFLSFKLLSSFHKSLHKLAFAKFSLYETVNSGFIQRQANLNHHAELDNAMGIIVFPLKQLSKRINSLKAG